MGLAKKLSLIIMQENIDKLHTQLKIRSSRLYWTYVIQYNQAEVYQKTQKRLTIGSLVLSGLVASTAFMNVLQICGITQEIGNIIVFALGITSTTLLAFIAKFDYEKRIANAVEYGTKIRRLWMKYQSLITDMLAGRYLSYEQICDIRDRLRDEEYSVLHDAPITLQKAYEEASKKIKNGHGDITPEEIEAGNEQQNL